MAKTLNKWLDEFIENGADASDVTNWPENAGGGGGGEIIALEGAGGKTYSVAVDELLKLIKNITGTYYSIGDSVFANDSSSGVNSCISLTTNINERAISIKGIQIASIAESSFSSWYDFINDNRTAIEQQSVYLDSGSVFVGVIRTVSDYIVGTFDISKLLIEQE